MINKSFTEYLFIRTFFCISLRIIQFANTFNLGSICVGTVLRGSVHYR